jgi:hypothetical protein
MKFFKVSLRGVAAAGQLTAAGIRQGDFVYIQCERFVTKTEQ